MLNHVTVNITPSPLNQRLGMPHPSSSTSAPTMGPP